MPRHKILIVDDQEFILDILIRSMHKAGFEAITATNGLDAVEMYKREKPTVVISDVIMPKMNGLTLLSEIKKIDERALVVLITGFGNEEVLLEALRGGAINFFRKPFKVEEVIEVVTNAVKHRTAFAYHELSSPDFLQESKAFSLKISRASLLPVVNQIVINCGSLFSEAEIINIKIGIEEMITNAIEHGCLGIGYESKRQALVDGNFYDLCRRRLVIPENSDKCVRVSSTLTQDQLSVEVSDCGPGFDWRNLPEVSSESIQSFNGRGILLTRIFFDEVVYNDAGNSVTLRKMRNNGHQV